MAKDVFKSNQRPHRKLTLKEVMAALTKSKGLVAPAADMLGTSRRTIYNYINKHEEVKDHVEQQRQAFVDFAEAKLFSLIQNGDTTAVIFTLKTLGKKRGYVERQEVSAELHGVKEMPSINLTIDGQEMPAE